MEGTEISGTEDGSMLVMVEEQLEGKFGMKSGEREEMKLSGHRDQIVRSLTPIQSKKKLS